jgi:Predicted transcriptional regulator
MNLKQRLSELNMSQKELAELTGISKQSISSYCNGVQPSSKNQQIIDEILPTIKPKEPELTDPYGLPIPEAAKLIGFSPQALREALKQQRVAFGFAVQTSDNRWRYHVSKAGLSEYLGVSL